MDDNGSIDHHRRRLQTLTKANSFNTDTANNGHSRPGGFHTDGFGERRNDEGGQSDAEVWGTFADNFRQVQSVLDRNSVLIKQVNENHRSKVHDNLVKNVALIQEINGNISKIVSLYSDLGVNFSSMFHGEVDAKNNDGKGDTFQA